MIETFNTLDDAILFLETLGYEAKKDGGYFKAELLLLHDGRFRVGVTTLEQLELFDGFLD
jgi:hypothetical protein